MIACDIPRQMLMPIGVVDVSTANCNNFIWADIIVCRLWQML